MNGQVEKKHYKFFKYCDEERFASYWHQIKEVLKLSPATVLEIGVGDKVFYSYLKNNTGINYTGVDLAKDLGAEIIADVTKLPFENNRFDVVCAFEVLEHKPFEEFVTALLEMQRVSRKYVVMSLPHWGRHFSFLIRLPYFKKIKRQHKFNFWPIKNVFKGEHYWEIGKSGFSLEKVKGTIKTAGLEIVSDYVAFGSPYHHFFVMRK